MKIKMKDICLSLIPKTPLTLIYVQVTVHFNFFYVFFPFANLLSITHF